MTKTEFRRLLESWPGYSGSLKSAEVAQLTIDERRFAYVPVSYSYERAVLAAYRQDPEFAAAIRVLGACREREAILFDSSELEALFPD
jgi:hypothetical protein